MVRTVNKMKDRFEDLLSAETVNKAFIGKRAKPLPITNYRDCTTKDQKVKFLKAIGVDPKEMPELKEAMLKIEKDAEIHKAEREAQGKKLHKMQEEPLQKLLTLYGLSDKATKKACEVMQKQDVKTLRTIRDVVVNKEKVPYVFNMRIIPFNWRTWGEQKRLECIEYLNYLISQKEHKKEIEEAPEKSLRKIAKLFRRG